MPRKRSVQEIAQATAAAQKKRTGSGKGQPKKRAAPKRGAARKRPSRSKRHPTTAEILKRNQQIVVLRDVEFMTFTQIASELGIDEKTAREGYGLYVDEIAPMFLDEDAFDKAAEFVRKLESAQAAFAKMVGEAQTASIRLRALELLVSTMWKEMELRQHIGQLPKEMGTLRVVGEIRWVAQQVIGLLKKYEAPPEAFVELHEIVSGRRDN